MNNIDDSSVHLLYLTARRDMAAHIRSSEQFYDKFIQESFRHYREPNAGHVKCKATTTAFVAPVTVDGNWDPLDCFEPVPCPVRMALYLRVLWRHAGRRTV